MADQEQLDILMQGVKAWNQWRSENKTTRIDLRGAFLREANLDRVNFSEVDFSGTDLTDVKSDLSGAFLVGADLRGANLEGAYFKKANLLGANLNGACLKEAHLKEVNLADANLWGANLVGADMENAILWRANLYKANFTNTNLISANLRESDLTSAKFIHTDLTKTDFSLAEIGQTVFAFTDLSNSKNLGKVVHTDSSSMDIATLVRFQGKIPETFFRGCGLSDLDIEYSKLYNPDLTNEEINKILYKIYDFRATQALQISPLFISYSHADNPFVDHLDSTLTSKGVRFWRDIHDATAGRLETQIDRAIRQNPTVLLILSKNSLNSDWVQHEVRQARELEKELGRDALCPVALDDSWKSASWPARIMEQVMEYNILDFSGWRNDSTFEAIFAKLLSGLDLFYKKANE